MSDSILNKMRVLSEKTLYQLEHFIGTNPTRNNLFNNLQGNGIMLASVGVLIGFGAILPSSDTFTVATLSASTLFVGTSMGLLGKIWAMVRAPEIEMEKKVKQSLTQEVEVICQNGKIENISKMKLFELLENKSFYSSYDSIKEKDFTIKPHNSLDYLRQSMSELTPFEIKQYQDCLSKAMLIAKPIFNKNKIHLFRQEDSQKNTVIANKM
jgi:hypothetical protein